MIAITVHFVHPGCSHGIAVIGSVKIVVTTPAVFVVVSTLISSAIEYYKPHIDSTFGIHILLIYIFMINLSFYDF